MLFIQETGMRNAALSNKANDEIKVYKNESNEMNKVEFSNYVDTRSFHEMERGESCDSEHAHNECDEELLGSDILFDIDEGIPQQVNCLDLSILFKCYDSAQAENASNKCSNVETICLDILFGNEECKIPKTEPGIEYGGVKLHRLANCLLGTISSPST